MHQNINCSFLFAMKKKNANVICYSAIEVVEKKKKKFLHSKAIKQNSV